MEDEKSIKVESEQDLIKLFGQSGQSSFTLKAINDWLLQGSSEPDDET